MQPNPFAPPQTTRIGTDAGARHLRKPISVWVVQSILLLIGWLDADGMLSLVRRLLSGGTILASGLVAWVSVDVLILAGLAAALFGGEFRQAFARWLGLAFVLFFFGACGYFFLLVDPAAEPSAVTIDHALGLVAIVSGLAIGWWFAFSAKARAWFRVGFPARGGDDVG